MLTIRLFGQLHVQFDGIPVEVCRRPQNASLLAYLLLQKDHPISRDRLAFDLWPDAPEGEARANLRRHLHQLRRALPASSPDSDWILVEGRALRWNPEADGWIDVFEFERLARSDPTLDQAIALYQGSLLQDVYDDWLFYERDRLQTIYHTALSRLVLSHRSQRNYAGALTYAHELLHEDPFREDALRQVMLLQYELGNRAGALAEAKADYELMIQAVQTAAKGAFVRQAFEASRRLCLEGLELSRQIGFREEEADAHQLLGAIYGRLSDPRPFRNENNPAGKNPAQT